MTSLLRIIFNRSQQRHEVIPSTPRDEEYIDGDHDQLQQNVEIDVSTSPEDDNEAVENWSDIELNQNNNNSSNTSNDFGDDDDVEMGGLRIFNSVRVVNSNSRDNRIHRISSTSEDDNETSTAEDTVVNNMMVPTQDLDDSDENDDAEAVYRSIFALQEEVHNNGTNSTEDDDSDSIRVRRIMMVACLIPLSIFILLSLSSAPDPDDVPPTTDDGNNDNASDTSSTMDEDGNYQLFSILFFMSFMNIICAFLERAGANSATHTHVTIPSSSVDENGESVTAATASLHLMSFEAQLTAAILESRRVQLLELLGRSDEINPSTQNNTGVSEEISNAWCQYDFQFDNDKHDPALPPACSICLCEYEGGEKIVRLPCHHEYHDACLLSWTSSHVRCPLCNYDLENDEVGS